MSFLVPSNRSGEPDLVFEQFPDLIAYITDQLAAWNNFEVEQGVLRKSFTIVKPTLTNTLGVIVSDETTAGDKFGG